jgi:hypothetical protein
VLITLTPGPGETGPTTSTFAAAVATVVGTTRRVTFRLPDAIGVTAPTAYRVSLTGVSGAGARFASANDATLAVVPPASVASAIPSVGRPGQALSVVVTARFSNFVQGATRMRFGDGISVGGAADGTFGLVSVTSPTTAIAQIIVGGGAPAGARTVDVQTGVQVASLVAGFSVVP